MKERKVWVVLHGSDLNHDNEDYELYSTSDIDKAHSIIDNVEKICKESESECSFDWKCINTTSRYVYVIWLNELSRIYAGMDILSVVDNLREAKQDFHDIWQHQTYRWNFNTIYTEGQLEEPTIGFDNSNIKIYWRNNCDDCEQTLGIARLIIND